MRFALVCLMLTVFVCHSSSYAQSNPLAPPPPAATPRPTKSTPEAVDPPAATPGIKYGKEALSSLPPEKSQPVHVPRFENTATADGKLDAHARQQAKVLKDEAQAQPG